MKFLLSDLKKFLGIFFLIFVLLFLVSYYFLGQKHRALGAGTSGLVQTSTLVSAGGNSYTFNISSSGAGNLLVFGAHWLNGVQVTSVTDNKGDAWSMAYYSATGGYSNSGNGIWYKENNPGGVTTVNITFSGFGSQTDGIFGEYSGVASSGSLIGSSFSNQDGVFNAGNFTSGSVVVNSVPALAIGFTNSYYSGTSYSWTSGASFTKQAQTTDTNAMWQDQIINAASSVNSTGSISPTGALDATVAVFKLSSGSNPTPTVTPTPTSTPTPTPTPTPTSTPTPTGTPTPTPTVPPSSAAPILYFSDLDSGPKTGGENNNGAYVTLYGNNFGSSSTVTVGGGQAIIKLAPAVYQWYQKMTIQLGPNAASGNIVVTNSNGSSNSIPFTVRSGNIYFVATNGSDGAVGSFAVPWATLLKARNSMAAGDITYAENGVSQSADDGSGWSTCMLLDSNSGTAGNPKAFVAYPGATATIGSNTSCAFAVRSKGTGNDYWTFAGFTFLGGSLTLNPYNNHNWRIVGNDLSCPNGNDQAGCLDIGGDSANGGSHDISIYGNNIHNVGTSNAPSAVTALYHGVYFSETNHNIDFGWNTVANVYGGRCIQQNVNEGSGSYSLSIHDNVIHDCQLDGIVMTTLNPSAGAVNIYNNVIYNAGKGPSNAENSGAWNCMNIQGWVTSSAGAESGTVNVYNNTMYGCGTFASPPYGGSTGGFLWEDGNTSTKHANYYNNIIYMTVNQPYFNTYNSNQGSSCSSNCEEIQGTKNDFFGSGLPPTNSQLTGSLNLDPQFVNASAANFTVQNASLTGVGANLNAGSGVVPTPTPTPTSAPVIPSGGGSGGGGGGGGGTPSGSPTNPVTVYIPAATGSGTSTPTSGQPINGLTTLRLINDNGTYYLIQNGVRQGITNPGMLYSYGFSLSEAVPATAADKALPLGPLLLPGDGALVKSLQDPTVYLVSGGQRHGFTSADVFLGLGFKWTSVLVVTAPELNQETLGSIISNASSQHLEGLNINEKGTVYWVGPDNQLHAYPSLATFNSWNIPNDFTRVVPANGADLGLPVGTFISMRDLQ